MLMELHIQGLNFSYGEKKVFEGTIFYQTWSGC